MEQSVPIAYWAIRTAASGHNGRAMTRPRTRGSISPTRAQSSGRIRSRGGWDLTRVAHRHTELRGPSQKSYAPRLDPLLRRAMKKVISGRQPAQGAMTDAARSALSAKIDCRRRCLGQADDRAKANRLPRAYRF